MITYRLQIAILQRIQPLTIEADTHRINPDTAEVEFIADGRLIATVPRPIIVALTES